MISDWIALHSVQLALWIRLWIYQIYNEKLQIINVTFNQRFWPFLWVPDSVDGRKRFRYAWTTRIFFDEGKVHNSIFKLRVLNRRLNSQGPVARSLVSANRWLRGIKMYRFPWYLTLVSTNHASSNPGQVVCLFAWLLFAETKGIVTERSIYYCLLLRISETVLTETTNTYE